MRAAYRIVHFVANPFSGLSFPVAALVRGVEGEVSVVMPTGMPDSHCLGSMKAANALLAARDDLAELTSFEGLPRHFGPHFTLTAPQHAPVDEPDQWVRRTLFPPVLGQARRPRRKSRASKGKKFLDQRGVEVQRHYRPPGAVVQPVTHYVEHEGGLFLLEPLVLRSEDHELANDIREAVTHLRAMHDLLGDEPAGYYTYLLHGVGPRFHALVQDDLADFMRVVDTTEPAQEHAFIEVLRPRSVLTSG